MLGFRIIAEFGAAIAVPAVLAAVIGRRLDETFGTRPLLLVASLATAFAATAVTVTRRARDFAKDYEEIIASSAKRAGVKDPLKEE